MRRRFARPQKPALCAGNRRLAVGGALVAVLALGLGACGGSGGGSSGASGGSSGDGELVVLGASSLTEAVTEYAESFPAAKVRTSFAGSDTLAAQIRQGAKADVFLSADTEYPRQLHREGLVERPVVFAANQLVVIVSGRQRDRLARAVGEAGREAGDRRRKRPGRRLHAGSPRAAAAGRKGSDLRQRPLRRTGGGGGRRQGPHRRRRRRLRLPHRRQVGRRGSRRRSRSRPACSPTSPTAAPSSAAAATRKRRASSSPA